MNDKNIIKQVLGELPKKNYHDKLWYKREEEVIKKALSLKEEYFKKFDKDKTKEMLRLQKELLNVQRQEFIELIEHRLKLIEEAKYINDTIETMKSGAKVEYELVLEILNKKESKI